MNFLNFIAHMQSLRLKGARPLFIAFTFCLFLFTNIAFAHTEPKISCHESLQESSSLRLNPLKLSKSVDDAGLTAKEIEVLKNNSLGFLDLYELIREGHQEGYLLGLSHPQELHHAIARATGLTEWTEAYQAHGIESGERQHTEKFMEAITQSGKKIVFLVPSRLWTYPKGIYTKREMWWLLKHPSQLKNVKFVFGSLEIFDDESWDEFYSATKAQSRQALETRSLRDIRSILLSQSLKSFAAETELP